MMDFTTGGWIKHALTNSEGFEDMRWKKTGSLKIAFVIITLLFLALIFHDRLTGFQLSEYNEKLFSVVPYIMESFVLFGMWTVGNWAVCTLLDGEGTMRNICIFSAYALIPYTAQLYIRVLLSQVLISDESVFLDVIEIIGTLWTVILLFSAVKAVHNYTFSKTAAAIILTLAAMIIMFILLLLFMSLIQQVWIFISTVITEISYRMKT